MKQYKDIKIIGVDHGNYNCKTETACFTSSYKELAPGDGFNFKHQVEFEGRRFALTQNRMPIADDKTENDDFFILTLFGIGMEFAYYQVPSNALSSEYPIILGTALPPGHMAVPGLQDRMREYFKRRAQFSYNGTSYKINIDKVMVSAQGYAPLYAPVLSVEMQKMAAEDKLLGCVRPLDILEQYPNANVIDLGGGTFDVVPYQYGVPQPSVNLSKDQGIVRYYNEIGGFIRAATGQKVDESIIDSVIKKEENIIVTDQVRELIEKGVERYSQKLLNMLFEFELPFQNSYNMVMGGAAIPVAPYWARSERFGILDYLTEIKATAMGLEEQVMELLSDKKAG